MQFKPKKFHFKTQSDNESKSIGFMAQDVQPFFPELVEEITEGKLGMSYSGFGVLAIGGIQELKAEKDEEISELRETIEALAQRIEELENK